MTNRKTYRVFEEDERELVYEDVLNDHGQIVVYKDYQSPTQAEGLSEYDKDGHLVLEKEIVEGIEGYRTEYKRNSKGDVINSKLFIADELYEEIEHEFLDHGSIRRTYQNGEETERIAENKDGEKYVKEFFMGSELVERHNGIYNPNTFIEKVEVTDKENKLIATREQQFDQSDNLLKFEQKNNKGNLLVSSEYQYQNGEVVFEKHEDYTTDQYIQVSYEYDVHGNRVSQEIRTPSGKLLEYQKQIYDDKNRMINESGYSVGSFNAIYGTYVIGEKYIFEHEYSE
jgi:hypothetical protein